MGNCLCCEDVALRRLEADSVPLFSLDGHTYRCRVVDVYDGDTITIVFRRRREWLKMHVRMLGYDSPEMKPRLMAPNRDEIKRRAVAARDALRGLCLNRLVTAQCGKWDKYGRLLATIYTDTGVNVNAWMLEQRHGVPYDGGHKTI